MGRKLKVSKENKSWEIVYYRIYVLSLRPKPIRRRKYSRWMTFNTSPIYNNERTNSLTDATSSGTNENNVDLIDRNSNELKVQIEIITIEMIMVKMTMMIVNIYV